jgi:CubicO group peptidase (beta-lactamase class C family)
MSKDDTVKGYVSPGFEKVEAVFRYNFNHRKEVGAAFCVYKDGKKVVDLWGGHQDKEQKKPWDADTVCMVFSTTKGISSMAFAMLHAKGLIDYDEPVAKYWPDFAKRGKAAITIRQLLAHQAGLCTTDVLLTKEVIEHPNKLSEILARQKPYWEPGTRQGYHAWTIAMYQNEILKWVDPKRRPLHVFFREEIAEPLGLDIHIGLPDDFNPHRVADLVPFNPLSLITDSELRPEPWLVQDVLFKPGWFFVRSLLHLPFVYPLTNFNKQEYRRLPIGSGCGFTSARDLAALYYYFSQAGDALEIPEATLAEIENDPVYPTLSTMDIAIRVRVPFSLGFVKPSDYMPFGVNHRAYGSFGAGGSAAFADPEANMSMAYVMNRMGTSIGNDPRETALRRAVYECLM